MSYALTKDFVEKVVGEKIKSFEVKTGSNEGDNVQGVLKAISVITATEKTLHLVHKTMVDDPMFRVFIVESQTFRIENTFYSRIAPAIENLIKSRLPNDYKLPMPHFYAGFNNDADDYITMEDLRPSGYKMADKYAGLNLAQVSLVLKELGRFHAFTYFFVKHEGEKFFDTVEAGIKKARWLEPDKQAENEFMQKEISKIAVDVIAGRNPDLAKKVDAMYQSPSAPEVSVRTTMSTDKKYFPIIIHGDMWVNNIMFKYDSNGNPEAVKFIDFQMVRRANLFEELQYFFLSSTTSEFRRRHLHGCLSTYYRSFTATLEKLHCPVPSYFTLGFLVDNMFEAFVSQFHFTPFVVSLQLGEKPKMPEGQASDSGKKENAPSKGPSENPPAFNPMDLPMEVRVGFFMSQVRAQLEGTPKAIDRLLQITEEFAELALI